MTCLPDALIIDWLHGRADATTRASAEAHVDTCEHCRRVLVGALRLELTRSSAGRAPAAPARGPPEGLMGGARLGRRYVLLERLGAGRTGTVFSALDTLLDRRVALKCLRRGLTDTDTDAVLREAQRLARLNHPNVVAVYDVGEAGDQAFIAMEYVEGRTLREWLQSEPPRWREALKFLLQAGEGLGAAHAAGIHHRDFKPENVLIGDDGRVRVGDFGLAVSTEEAGANVGPVGTPLFMAPEVSSGGAADARSDQYSFAVCLHLALFGGFPRDGLLPPRPAVPAVVRRALLRALTPSPEQRYPDMAALLEHLRSESWAGRRRRLVAVGAGGLFTATLIAGTWAERRNASQCDGVGERVARVIDSSRLGDLRAGFLATNVPYAARALENVTTELTRYASAWSEQRVEVCRAARARREESPQLSDRRAACLEARLEELDVVIGSLTRPDAALVSRALNLVEGLTPLKVCSDLLSREEGVAPPPPQLRRAVDALAGRLARVRALHLAGFPVAATVLGETHLREARSLAYQPLEAEAHFVLGKAARAREGGARARRELERAALAAHSVGDERLSALAWLELASVVRYDLGQFEEGELYTQLAVSAARRATLDPELGILVDRHLGLIANGRGKFSVAADHFGRALRHAERVLGVGHRRVALLQRDLGDALAGTGKQEEGLALVRQSASALERLMGEGHPNVADGLSALGQRLLEADRPEEALTPLRRALAIRERLYAPTHSGIIELLSHLAQAEVELGHGDVALELGTRAVRAATAAGPTPFLVISTMMLGETYASLGRHQEALAVLAQALSRCASILGPNHWFAARIRGEQGRSALALGDPTQALAALRGALSIIEKGAGPDSPLFVGQVKFDLARAMAASSRDARQALKLADEAERALRTVGADATLRELAEWRARLVRSRSTSRPAAGSSPPSRG